MSLLRTADSFTSASFVGTRTAASGRLRGALRAVAELDAELRDAMWALFQPYYADVKRATFDADLARKQYVVLAFDSGDRRLRGFSTLEVYQHEVDGRPATILFSGDTIVDPRYWGQRTLQTVFYRFVLQLKLRRPFTPIYWFVISKGYKTYLVLARTCVEYWPREGRATPPHALALLDSLARRKFGAMWKPELGIMRPPSDEGRLHADVAPIDAEALRVPEIRFFAERNPGHRHADELVCVGALDLRTFLRFAAKLLGGRGARTGGR